MVSAKSSFCHASVLVGWWPVVTVPLCRQALSSPMKPMLHLALGMGSEGVIPEAIDQQPILCPASLIDAAKDKNKPFVLNSCIRADHARSYWCSQHRVCKGSFTQKSLRISVTKYEDIKEVKDVLLKDDYKSNWRWLCWCSSQKGRHQINLTGCYYADLTAYVILTQWKGRALIIDISL